GAGDEEKSVGPPRQFVNLRGQTQFLAGEDAIAAKPDAQFRMSVSPVDRGANAPGGIVLERNAKLPFAFELLPLKLVQQPVSHGRDVLGSERVFVSQDDFAVDAIGGGD